MAEIITPAIEDSESAVLKIISFGMANATEEAVKKIGEETITHLLLATIVAPVAGPLAAGAAALLSTIAKELFRETSAIERKLDKVLAQPFKTASRTVTQILSEEVRDDAEEARLTERLKTAADQLDVAYTYAEDAAPRKLLLVRLFQSLVAALLEGGGAALRRNLAELRELAAKARREAARWREDAERVRRRDPAIVSDIYSWHNKFANLPGSRPGAPSGVFVPSYLPPEHLSSILQAQEDGDIRRAEEFDHNATALENLCTLLENVHESRRMILRAQKQSLARSRLASWLGLKG